MPKGRFRRKIFVLGESAGALLSLRHGLGRACDGLPLGPVAGYIFSGPIVTLGWVCNLPLKSCAQEGEEGDASRHSEEAWQAEAPTSLRDWHLQSAARASSLPLPLALRSKFFPRLPLPGVDVVSTFDAAFGEPRWAAAGKADPVVRRVLDARFHVRQGVETWGLKGAKDWC